MVSGPPRPVTARLETRPVWAGPLLWTVPLWFFLVLVPAQNQGGVLMGTVLVIGLYVFSLAINLRNWFLKPEKVHYLSLEEDGLFYIQGRTARLLPYEDITGVRHVAPPKAFLRWRVPSEWPGCELFFPDAAALRIPEDSLNYPAFCRMLLQITFPIRYAPYAQLLNRDGYAAFGQSWVTEAGLQKSTGVLIPWEKIHALTVSKGQIRYRPMEQFGSPVFCPVDEVPNLDVFFSLGMSLATRRRRLV